MPKYAALLAAVGATIFVTASALAAPALPPPGPGEIVLAPLPALSLPAAATPHDYLAAAQTALAAGRTAEAQNALEHAETRALARSVRPSRAGIADANPLVATIAHARAALRAGDKTAAAAAIDAGLRLAK